MVGEGESADAYHITASHPEGFGAKLVMERALAVFFFKQKTAYEMESRDWSSDVCSSDLMKSLSVA